MSTDRDNDRGETEPSSLRKSEMLNYELSTHVRCVSVNLSALP